MAQQQQQLPQLFGIIPTSHPCLTLPTSAPTPTSYLYTLPLPSSRPFSHITVFLLPGITLPPATAAAVYISLPSSSTQSNQPSQPQFRFLGGIGPGKESAVFKISGLGAGGAGGGGNGGGAGGEVDMDSDIPSSSSSSSGEITLGISLESADSVSAQISALHSTTSTTSSTSNPSSSDSQAMILARVGGGNTNQETTVKLAQKIIKNAFNFLASFSGNTANGIEVVPLKAFEEWWRKFEGRVRSDAGFLERGEGD
ncbi:uncharacterized protein LY89DRAFT_743531 [Mollisia scopiformis]|uniref:Uncharacterized protein n=1 Tax=Mollisia scopiformis TaxID=149040 RepID=A0A132B3B6_MOLSC|nr:uncharacterized protein LY89DRAFT_743531 [Mollisia scopiformis]KUJ06895.1 hypothetical protein LY89DRAFT_743531 [Mollisia scopiformis]